MSRPRVSAIITTYNEETHIGACLASLAWCDERIVIDSFSTDDTPRIVREHAGVQFHQRPYEYAASQKNRALELACHPWILVFDADERCPPALRDEILAALAAEPSGDAFVISRRAYVLGHAIRRSGWKNDRVARLFRNGSCRYQDRRVHARLLLRDGRVALEVSPTLKTPMEHHMVDSMSEYTDRLLRYSRWGAAQAWLDGKRTTAPQVFLRPAWRFVRTYLLQLGILDGPHGLVFCSVQAFSTFGKLAILWGWQQNEKRGLEPDLPQFASKSGAKPTDAHSAERGADRATPDRPDGAAPRSSIDRPPPPR